VCAPATVTMERKDRRGDCDVSGREIHSSPEQSTLLGGKEVVPLRTFQIARKIYPGLGHAFPLACAVFTSLSSSHQRVCIKAGGMFWWHVARSLGECRG
jgi:hypothetical protein